jgi:hypothetical protein
MSKEEMRQTPRSFTITGPIKIKAPPTRRKDKTCGLLSLPGELRNNIYELCLAKSTYIYAERATPALTATCRQIRQESLPIYYGLNTFRFSRFICGSEPSGKLDVHARHIRLMNKAHLETSVVFTQW